LGDKTFRKPWKNECLSIGFGTSSTPVKGQVGWSSKSWGFHSDDGSFINNNKSISVSNPWKKGETYGVGIKYISKDNYKIFLTNLYLMEYYAIYTHNLGINSIAIYYIYK
jgi:hypothetical protein